MRIYVAKKIVADKPIDNNIYLFIIRQFFVKYDHPLALIKTEMVETD